MPFQPDNRGAQWSLSLDSYVVRNPASTFFMRTEGDSMRDEGIFSGDLLVVDRSIEPSAGRVVLAVVDGDFAVRRFSELDLSDESGCYVWGTVVGAVHKL